MPERESVKDALNGSAHTSRSSRNSGDASRPTSDLSPASDAPIVVARSSSLDSRLHLLEGKTIGVTADKNYRTRNCTNPSCDHGHAPVCPNYKTKSGCEFGDKCLFRHTEADKQPNKKLKKSGRQGSVALLKKSKHLGCVFQDTEPPRSKTILRKSLKSVGSDRTIRFSKGTLHHVKKLVKKASIARSYSEVSTSRAQSLCLKIQGQNRGRNLATRTMRPQRSMGIKRKMSTCPMKKTRPRSSHLQKLGRYQHFEET